MSPVYTFNEVEELTRLLESNNFPAVINNISKYNSVIDLLTRIKDTLFFEKESSKFYHLKNNKKTNLVLSSKEFLTNIPPDITTTINIKGLDFELGFPRICYTYFNKNLYTCIKSVDGISLDSNDIEMFTKKLPIDYYKELTDYIYDIIIPKLEDIRIYDTKNEEFKTNFTFSIQTLYELLFQICRYQPAYLKSLRIVLYKDGNFTYNDFDKFTVEEVVGYNKLIKEIYGGSE